jgi:hypothetical protein
MVFFGFSGDPMLRGFSQARYEYIHVSSTFSSLKKTAWEKPLNIESFRHVHYSFPKMSYFKVLFQRAMLSELEVFFQGRLFQG